MENFKEKLHSIITGEVKLVSEEFLDEMIENIGSIDPVLRDKLIYRAFSKLIFNNSLNNFQLEYILKKLLDNRLVMLNIEKPTTDSVFTRSFTVLVFAAVLEYDATNHIVDSNIVRNVIDATHNYMEKETDLRGYVEHKGWAHATAHGADLLDSIIKHPVANEEDALKVLQHVSRFLTIANGYQDDEEERLARAFVTLTKHHLNEDSINEWLLQLEQSLSERYTNANGELQPYYAKLAFKNFLKSSYFLLVKEDIQPFLQNKIQQLTIQQIY
ncbi:DUF2785 domain-containing protein [Psychrobacillus vulpis]|uniref:DUF2785 domain-containing protein n=1 Tax=Psychrobacillus vulpis TaxID=2325572 RepID=A0A544TSH7_9BACI|nr:DUF2785 domain-containing protein [Psychrobacillus vulpis]TQR20385.1 DUF2785 domain-containing protein [Psychrobacillus vulpis]